MARLSYKRGCPVWFPDRIDVTKKVTLLPELSPMENLWRIIDMQVSVWLNRYKVFSISKEMMEELEQSARVTVYSELLRRVRLGLYDRKWSFYYNVRSCAWSCMQRVIKQWLDQEIRRATEVDGNALISECPSDHSSMTFFDMVATESVAKLRTDSEYREQYKITNWREAIRKYDQQRILNESIVDDYSRYCEDCEELGVKPVDKVTFVCKSYTDEEHELMKYEPPKQTQYNRNYRQKLRSDPERLARRRAYDRAYHAKRKAEKEAKKKV